VASSDTGAARTDRLRHRPRAGRPHAQTWRVGGRAHGRCRKPGIFKVLHRVKLSATGLAVSSRWQTGRGRMLSRVAGHARGRGRTPGIKALEGKALLAGLAGRGDQRSRPLGGKVVANGRPPELPLGRGLATALRAEAPLRAAFAPPPKGKQHWVRWQGCFLLVGRVAVSGNGRTTWRGGAGRIGFLPSLQAKACRAALAHQPTRRPSGPRVSPAARARDRSLQGPCVVSWGA
jgi:hypothetical protein